MDRYENLSGGGTIESEWDNLFDDEESKRKAAEDFLRPRRRLFSVFARDSSLHFEPSESAETFAFYPNDFKVEVPLEWFASERFDEGELEFANYHELAHFIDMRKNPQAFLDNFERMEARADELAREYLQSHPGVASQDAVSAFFYKELHMLYNCLDDIYVNDVVASRNHKFDRGDGREDVVSLYQKNGYDNPDQTDQPLHRQMAFSLLRDKMVGKELGESVVSDEVGKALSRKFLGQTIPEIIDSRLKPQRGVLVDPAERYKIIRTVIEPTYLELLQEALENIDEPESSDNGGGSEEDEGRDDGDEHGEEDAEEGQSEGNEGQGSKNMESSFDPFDDGDNTSSSRSNDMLDKGADGDAVTEEILKSFVEQDEFDKMSPEERASYEQAKRQKAFDDSHGITDSERAEDTRIKAQISGERREMRKFWKGLIGKSIEYHSVIEPRQRRGRLNVDEYIRQYSQMVEAERSGTLKESQIYDRKGLERTIVDQPELIEVSLVIDCSGSMEGVRTDMAKQTAALLLYSLKDFNDELDRSRRQTHSRLRADTQVVCFGSGFSEVKPFDGVSTTRGTREANIIKSISAVNSDYGGTEDALPLRAIEEKISADDKARMKEGKLKKIVFEITDGEPFHPEETAQVVRRLAEDGVIMVGFRIGDISENDKEDFQYIWDGHNSHPNAKGITVGENLSALPKELMNALSNILSNIRI